VLLDTHTWIWLVGDDPRLGSTARDAIRNDQAASALYLSPISLWEIALKSSRGKLSLDLPLRSWLLRSIQLTGVHLTEINPDVACGCAELPADFHGDPADRLIAATARVEGMTLLTHDKALLALAKKGYFNALPT
jgi:PIN domain nuclease of toxin-antitoxin system